MEEIKAMAFTVKIEGPTLPKTFEIKVPQNVLDTVFDAVCDAARCDVDEWANHCHVTPEEYIAGVALDAVRESSEVIEKAAATCFKIALRKQIARACIEELNANAINEILGAL